MKESAGFKKYRSQLQDLPALQVNDVKHVSLAQVWFLRGEVPFVEIALDNWLYILSTGNDPGTAIPSRGGDGEI